MVGERFYFISVSIAEESRFGLERITMQFESNVQTIAVDNAETSLCVTDTDHGPFTNEYHVLVKQGNR